MTTDRYDVSPFVVSSLSIFFSTPVKSYSPFAEDRTLSIYREMANFPAMNLRSKQAPDSDHLLRETLLTSYFRLNTIDIWPRTWNYGDEYRATHLVAKE